MTNPDSGAPFTRADLPDLIAAQDRIVEFEKFVLDRFALMTRVSEVKSRLHKPIKAIDDPHARTSAGYGKWVVSSGWMTHLRKHLAAGSDENASIGVEHWLDDDRGPSSVTCAVDVPLSFVFDETNLRDDYATYLRLKALFEPTTAPAPAPTAQPPTGADTTDPTEGQQPTPPQGSQKRSERLEAARVLWVQSRDTRVHPGDGAHLAELDNRAEAAAAYREATAQLMSPVHAGMGDIRRQVHDAAATLGLTSDDLRKPKDDGLGDAEASNPSRNASTGLAFTLLQGIQQHLSGNHEAISTTDAAKRAYEKSRALVVLHGGEVFGQDCDRLISVMDDVADMLGIAKDR